MNRTYVSPFVVRQIMQQDDFEIFHRIDTAPGYISPHTHDFYEIYFPRTAGVSYIVEGRRYRLGPGMVVLIAPGQVHASDVETPGLVVERFLLWMNVGFVETLINTVPRFRKLSAEDLQGRNVITPDPETYEQMIGLIFSLLREKQLNDLDSGTLNRLVLAQLLILISRVLSGASGAPSPRYRDILRVYDYICAHLKEPLNVTTLAEQFFMDKNTLTRQFKRVTGMTPAECVRRRRLDAAHNMISHGANVTEIYRECGFSDYSAFYRAFRAVYGMSPSRCAALAGNSAPPEASEARPDATEEAP